MKGSSGEAVKRCLRVGALVALVGVTGVACDEGSIELQGNGEQGGPPSTFLIVPDRGGTPQAPRQAGASPEGAQSPEAPEEGGGGGAPSGEDSTPSGGSGAPAVTVDDRAGVGAMGPAFLRADVSEVAIEIDATPGESLTNQARSALQSQIEEHGSKQAVGFVSGSPLPEQDVYTTAQLRSLMETHRGTWSSGQRVAVYVMVLSGRHEDGGVVAVTFNASSFAVFPEQLGGGLLGLNYANYEEAAVVHELGHLLGLVNLTGQGGFHEDPAHEGHAKSDGSVMYWAVESTLVGDVFQGGPPRDFDADDEQEMDAIRSV